MNPTKMSEYMLARIISAHKRNKRPAPLILSGPPGGAKTETARLTFELLEEWHSKNDLPGECVYECLDMASLMPEDFTGLPHATPEGTTAYFPMERLARLGALVKDADSDHDPWGILVCDDASAAQQATLIVMFALLSADATVGGHQLSRRVLVIVTGNRREDKAGAFNLPSPIVNRCELRTDLAVDLKGWTDWAAKNGVPPIVSAFLGYKTDLLSQLPADTTDIGGRFATPRAWANLGWALDAMLKTNTLRAGAVGFVGEGPGIEFAAFHELREMINPAAILDGAPVPDGVADDPAKAYNLATALAEEASSRENDKAGACLKLLQILGKEMSTEYGAGGVRHYLQIDPTNAPAIISKLSWDKQLKPGSPEEKLYEAVCESVLE